MLLLHSAPQAESASVDSVSRFETLEAMYPCESRDFVWEFLGLFLSFNVPYLVNILSL